MNSSLKLILSLDNQVVREIELAKDRTTLGRRPYNDVVIDNLAVSGEHAVLQRVGDSVFLEDLNSTNGTYVNRKPVKRQLVGADDIIEIGRYRLQFVKSKDSSMSVAATPSPVPSFKAIDNLSAVPTMTTPTTAQAFNAEATIAGQRLNQLMPAEEPASQASPFKTDEQGLVVCRMKVLNGNATGKVLPLAKVKTTLGKPGVQVAALVRLPDGVEVQFIDGVQPLQVNNQTLQQPSRRLAAGDIIDIAGTRIELLIP